MTALKLLMWLGPYLNRMAVTTAKRRLNPRPPRAPNEVTDNFLMMHKATVAEVRRVASLHELQTAVRDAAARGLTVSMMGKGHSSDGHQFLDGALMLDLRGLNRLLAHDREQGTALIEAGMGWDALIAELQRQGSPWGIHVKQTLVNNSTLGGSVAVNIHARKMNSKPLIHYIRSLQLVDHEGKLRTLSRTQEPELFALVVGGYGAFGVVYAVELTLQRTLNLVRDVIPKVPLDEIAERYLEKMEAGYLYGDAHSNGAGLADNWCYMTMYRRDDSEIEVRPFKNTRAPLFLYAFGMYLLHADPPLALELWRQDMEKAGLSSTTDSCQFTSIGEYYDDVHGGRLGFDGQDMHVELQIEPHRVKQFVKDMRDVCGPLLRHCTFCDLRFVRQDDESFLRYARGDRFTLSPTFHMDAQNEAQLRPMYHRLYELAVNDYQGTFYLWDYFLGRPEHYLKAYPMLPAFFEKKRQYDPHGRFQSIFLKKLQAIVDGSSERVRSTASAS